MNHKKLLDSVKVKFSDADNNNSLILLSEVTYMNLTKSFDYVKKEISKVDFKNIEIYYKLHYKLPYWIVNFYYKLRSIISQVLKK